MGNNEDLEVYISKHSNTLPIMDRFEKCENGEKVYKRLIIKNIEKATLDQFIYSYKLIVERINYWECNAIGNITMSEFKQHKGKVTQYAVKSLSEYLKNHSVKAKSEIYFDAPYYLRAQNSANREGYGWEWEWDNLIYEGTEYGECDDYGFVGIIIDSIIIDKKAQEERLQRCYEAIPDPKRIEITSFQGSKYYKVYADKRNVYLIQYKKGLTQKEIIQEYKKLLYETGKGREI